MNRVMKDSGIEWFGEIPEEWDICRIKRVASIVTGNTPSKANGQANYSDDGLMWIKPDDLSETVSIKDTTEHLSEEGRQTARIVTAYTPLVCCIGTIGKVGYTDNETSFNQQINAICFNESVNKRFGLYLLISQEEQQKCYANGNVIKILNSESQGRLFVAIPPIYEQQLIADYLDKRCSIIDGLVAEKEKINELLKEWRQSIIYEAVTKGLDSSVPMKDSGIKWIGKIPKNWDVERLKYHACFNPNTDLPDLSDNDVVSFVPMDRLKTGFHLQAESVYSRVKKGYVVFKEEDILMAKVTPCLENGNLAIASNLINGIGFGSTEINVIRCFSISNKYLFYLLQCPSYIEKASYNMFGVAGLKRLDPKFIPYSFFPFPPHEDQLRISEYLDNKCAEIDIAIKINNTSIQKLKQYRQSLIYEAVTGKNEV